MIKVVLARDFRGHFLFYDQDMQPVSGDSQIVSDALWVAAHDPWPERDDWEEGPDPLHWPDLYDDDPDDEERPRGGQVTPLAAWVVPFEWRQHTDPRLLGLG